MWLLDWQLTWRESEQGTDHDWVPATVPGAVQRDWANATGLPEPHTAPDLSVYDWMEDVWWVYRAELPAGESTAGKTFRLMAEGIDYAFAIYRGADCLLRQTGMFTPVELDLGPTIAAGETIEIRIAPVPKVPGESGRSQARMSCKPAQSYGWDWHPRLVPSGIWRPCWIEERGAARLTGVQVLPPVGDGPWRIQVDGCGQLECRLTDPDGNLVATKSLDGSGSLAVTEPRLWWPRGQGEQALYTLGVQVDGRTELHRIGFRTVRLVMNSGAWVEPQLFPKSRSVAPATFAINGRRVFAKGANWITPKLYPGEISCEDFRELIDAAAAANFNCLRIWGGGIVNPPEFYALCDAAGIMVIQEFPLSCCDYPDEPDYLAVLDQESRAIITRLRRHPSLVAWSGGNELYNSWSGMTDQHLALRLLNRNTYDLDPHRPFLPTMPIEGMAHGPYTYFDRERQLEITQLMQGSASTAYTEFGQPGPASVDTLRAIIPAAELFPPRRGTAWERHHALGAFYPESWLGLNILEHLFGPSPDLETLVARGQWLQAFGYQMVYEEARRQWPHCAMALCWCFNEIWPCAANNSLLEWPAIPKPAYHAVAASCRPALLSAKLHSISWATGAEFRTQLWLLNDAPAPVPAGRCDATLRCGDATVTLGAWDYPEAPPAMNIAGPQIAATIPADWGGEQFTLELSAGELSQTYSLKLGRPSQPLTFADYVPDGSERLNQ